MTSLGLATFQRLCDCGNALEELRDRVRPTSDAWLALTELLYGVDRLIDTLVTSDALEED
jgi:hypothetical protein